MGGGGGGGEQGGGDKPAAEVATQETVSKNTPQIPLLMSHLLSYTTFVYIYLYRGF